MSNRMLKTIAALIFSMCLLSQSSDAQVDSLKYILGKIENSNDGDVKIHTTASIDSLEKKLRGKNNLRGFRIQIFLGSYPEAKKLRATFQSSSDNLPAYIAQNTPDYVVKVGDFRTLYEAQKYLDELKKSYPSALIIPDKIEPPRLKKSDNP
ncbi:MAG: SPOR domain-containing protein [Flavobacteriales bacterium]